MVCVILLLCVDNSQGMFDQIVHGVEEVEDIEALWISLKEKLTKIPNLPEGRAYQSFGHLCG